MQNIYSGLRISITNNITSLTIHVWSDEGIQLIDAND